MIKKLFCKHEYVFLRNIYGDEIIFGTPNFNRSIYRCSKCNKIHFGDNLEYNITTSAGHPTNEGDDIVRYSFEKRRVQDKEPVYNK